MGFCIVFPAASFAKSVSFLGLSVGYYNVLDGNDASADFQITYEPARSVVFKKLRPWLGIDLTTQGSIWGGAGLKYDFDLSDKWSLTPALGIGFYRHGKGDVDLNYPVQFKSQLELAYAFKNKNRISLGFSHISNAGLGRHNTGTEVLALTYYMPFKL